MSSAVPSPATWRVADPRNQAAVADALASQPLMARRVAAGGQGQVPFRAARLVSTWELFNCLDRVAYQLCFLAKLAQGVTLEAARADAPDLDVEVWQRAAQRLQLTGLATVRGDRLELVDELSAGLVLSQPSLADDLVQANSDTIGRACGLLGLMVPPRKAERVEALAGFLRDRDRLLRVLTTLSGDAVHLFERVVSMTLAGQTHGYEVRGSVRAYDVLGSAPEYRYGARTSGPLAELCDRQLLGSTWSRTEVWVWAETLVALRGHLFDDWAPEPEPPTEALDDLATRAAQVAGAVGDLVGHLAANPALAKRSGDYRPPVKYWRSAAKLLRIDAEQAVLLGELAIVLGLVVPVLGPLKGRGRNATRDIHWHPEPGRVAAFDELPLAHRWALIINTWMSDNTAEHHASAPLVLNLLCELPANEGASLAAFTRWATDRHRQLHPQTVTDIVGACAHLGLIPAPGGHVGLLPAGRAVCHSLEELDRCLSGGADTFVCQPDHTIIAPGDLQPALSEQLRRIATVESEGGATVWRLNAAAIGREALRVPVGQIVAFLHAHSSVPLPPSVERFVLDSGRTASPVQVCAVGCVVTGPDPATVADAARVKAAKLTVLAPGVAVSELSLDKVREVLVARGIVLAPSGAVVRSDAPQDGGAASAALPTIDPAVVAPTWMINYRPLGEALPDVSCCGGGLGPAEHTALATAITHPKPASKRTKKATR